jgi:GT2 family glycosyltransferase
MDLSIIIVNFNVYNDVLKCIHSINNTVKNISFEIIIIDNNSTNRDIELINSKYPDVKLILHKDNRGFGYANNIGMSKAIGQYILLVNPDIVFEDNSIEILYNFLNDNKSAGVVGPVQVKPNSGREYYYTFFPSLYSRLMQEFRLYMTAPIMKYRFFDFLDKNIEKGIPFEVDWVMGSCMMFNSEVYRKFKGFDESLFLYEEETELQYRIKASGLKVYMHPGANVLHNHHSSAGKIGSLFVHYHEFRSRIIFDSKRFKGLNYILRMMFIYSALLLRILYFFPKSLFSNSSKKKLKINIDLFKFSIKPRNEILSDKYDYDAKIYLFI